MLQTEARELRCQEHDQQMELQGSFCKRENVFIGIYAHWYKSFGKQHVVPVACGLVIARGLRVKKGPNIYTADKSAKLFLWLG